MLTMEGDFFLFKFSWKKTTIRCEKMVIASLIRGHLTLRFSLMNLSLSKITLWIFFFGSSFLTCLFDAGTKHVFFQGCQ